MSLYLPWSLWELNLPIDNPFPIGNSSISTFYNLHNRCTSQEIYLQISAIYPDAVDNVLVETIPSMRLDCIFYQPVSPANFRMHRWNAVQTILLFHSIKLQDYLRINLVQVTIVPWIVIEQITFLFYFEYDEKLYKMLFHDVRENENKQRWWRCVVNKPFQTQFVDIVETSPKDE